MIADRIVTIRDGAVGFRVLSAGRATPSSTSTRSTTATASRRSSRASAERHLVYAPMHPGAAGSSGRRDARRRARPDAGLRRAAGRAGARVGGPRRVTSSAPWWRRSSPPCSRGARHDSSSSRPLGLWRDDAPSADVLILPARGADGARSGRTRIGCRPGGGADPARDGAREHRRADRVDRAGAPPWQVRVADPDRGITKRLHRIAAPTLVLWGDDDRANPRGRTPTSGSGASRARSCPAPPRRPHGHPRVARRRRPPSCRRFWDERPGRGERHRHRRGLGYRTCDRLGPRHARRLTSG